MYLRCILLVLFLMFGGCKSKNLTLRNNAINSKVKELKIVFFQKCVVRSMKNAAVEEAFSRDISYSHDFSLGIENYELLDSLAKVVALEVERDSITWQQELRPISQEEIQRMYENRLIGKKSLRFCLDFYTGDILDSIAVSRIR